MPHGDLEALDADHAGSINGDGGGTWAPGAAIVIGGAGMQVALKDTTYPNFSASGGGLRTFDRFFSFAELQTRIYVGGSLVSWGLMQGQTLGSVVSAVIPVPDGAIVTKISPSVKIKVGHGALPATFPSLSVSRLDKTAQFVLTTVLLGGAADPVFMTAANVGAYENGGNYQTWDYVPNQNNTIDRSKHILLATITDEGGLNAIAGNLFAGLTVEFTHTQLGMY